MAKKERYPSKKNDVVVKPTQGKAMPNEHWQVNRNITPAGNNTGWGAFLPRSGRSRPQPYDKINECDH